MEQAMAQGLFVEVAEVDKDLYGTCIQAVTKEQNAGKVCVLHIDLAGVEQLRQSSMQPVCVWLEPPSLEALRQRYSVYLLYWYASTNTDAQGACRLVARGVPDEAELTERLEQAERDMVLAREKRDLFDFTLINDELADTYAALKQVLARAYPHMRQNLPPPSDP